jgi:hypothetical protein
MGPGICKQEGKSLNFRLPRQKAGRTEEDGAYEAYDQPFAAHCFLRNDTTAAIDMGVPFIGRSLAVTGCED